MDPSHTISQNQSMIGSAGQANQKANMKQQILSKRDKSKSSKPNMKKNLSLMSIKQAAIA
jgi:hypothetical protein